MYSHVSRYLFGSSWVAAPGAAASWFELAADFCITTGAWPALVNLRREKPHATVGQVVNAFRQSVRHVVSQQVRQDTQMLAG
eukprot:10385974-Alexandrium_andersonii.AAC.1